ncbi:hypothetical protein L7F22_006232 [Adiantum nelumboides]|nr:hypothetical protein [Adiantum nelumboides]
MEGLIGAPTTLDVQHFANARATELLSLHSLIKTGKRKAFQEPDGSSLGDGDGITTHNNGDDGISGIDVSGLSNASTSLPRHLRRRTSSYVRRRRPLPWLYKKKKKPCISFSSLFERPKKRRKQRLKKRLLLLKQNPAPNSDTAPSPRWSDEFLNIPFRFGSDNSPIAGLRNHNLSPVQNIYQDDLQEPNVNVFTSFQASGTGSISSVNIHGANALVQLDNNDEAALENAETAGALTHVGCFVSEEKSANFPHQAPQGVADVSSMDIEVTLTTLECISNDACENSGVDVSQNDINNVISASEEKTASQTQVAGQAAEQEAAPMSLDGIAPPIQEVSHEVQQESAVNGGSSVCLAVDQVTEFACHIGQEGSTDHLSTGEVHAPMCVDGVVSNRQMGTFGVQDIKKTKKKKLCRSLRRLLDFKPCGSFISSDGNWRLATHVWHAKRFTIEKQWGYRIPLGRHGRGHGSRSILRWSKSKALLQDCSFISAIQLIGSEEKICQVLRPVLELPEGMGSYLQAGQGSFSEGYVTTAILHHVNQIFGIICPAIMMWKPVMPEVSISSCTEKRSESLQERNLWLWVHAAAFEEAYQMVKDVCFQVNEHKSKERVVCVSRKGDLGRLNLTGEGSFAVLQKVLFPIYRDSQGKCIKLEQLTDTLKSKQANRTAVVHLEVSDPRLKENERCLALDPVCISPVTVFDDRCIKEKDFTLEDIEASERVMEHVQETLNTTNGEEAYYNTSIEALWACGANSCKHKYEQPLAEKFLSRMRHTDRLDAFGLAQTAKSSRMLERRKTLSHRFSCPVILLQHEHEEASACGWSLILPLSWISAFWVPLVFAGGHVIGIRERHWLCTNVGSPAFPDDFPDCKAYWDKRADKSLEAAESFCKSLNMVGQDQINVSTQEDAVQNALLHSQSMSCGGDEDKTQNVAGLEYSYFVARTSEQLVSYLQMTHQTGLLLFPAQKHTLTKFRGMGSHLREGTIVWRPKPQNQRTAQSSQAVCLLRVCLRPFCRGVVKAGAKVYAPTSEDYSVWCCKERESGASVSRVCRSEEALGYVTSMAPHGSKVSAAIAFCDATALGFARQCQWVDTTWHKKCEVFLMFCNQGSTTLRPALASICIEAGPDI